MKFVILKINCDISDITILQKNNKNIVFDSYKDIDDYFYKENLESNNYAILHIDYVDNKDFQQILR
jgi:hypothetical protein